MAKEFAHDEGKHRYTLTVDGQLMATADYVINGDSISFNHTYPQPTHRGQGLAGEVVTYAMDDVEKNTTLKVVPMCWYVGKWFDEHPERAALLSR